MGPGATLLNAIRTPADPAAGPPAAPAELAEARYTLMGGDAEIRLGSMGRAHTKALLSAAVEETRRIEAKYSRYRHDSLLARINGAAGSGRPVEVDEETAGLLDFAARLYAESAGRFDVTSGVLRRAWDFRAPRLPSAEEIAALLPLVGWPRLRWDATRRCITLAAGMELDFGGFGKEYAADRAVALLLQGGARHGYVNLGGDIRVLGPRPDGTPWHFGIRDPRRADRVMASLELDSGALATSGDYERYFEIDGLRYCHILDPRDGRPAQHWRSFSVGAPLCLAAGALATCAMLHGADAPAWLDQQGLDFLAIDHQGGRHRGRASAFQWSDAC